MACLKAPSEPEDRGGAVLLPKGGWFHRTKGLWIALGRRFYCQGGRFYPRAGHASHWMTHSRRASIGARLPGVSGSPLSQCWACVTAPASICLTSLSMPRV
jgi:hypothetical protein